MDWAGIDEWIYRRLTELVDVLPMRFVKLVAHNYTDARVRKLYWRRLGLEMGEGTYANLGLTLLSDDYTPRVHIGNHVSIAANVTFVPMASANNGQEINTYPYVRDHLTKAADIVVEDEVWIGADVTILPGVARIDTRAFSDCAALKEITIPASVTAIGDSAFSGCLALRTVHFGGSKEAWQAVEVGEHNTLLRLASVDYNAVTGHHFGDWTVTTEPTCDEPGVRTRTCADAGCAETETEAIPALGHDWGEGVTVAEPSGAQGGRVRTTCKRCGAESLRFTDPEIPAYQQFDDVDFALWSYPGIAFCVKTGLMSGTDAHTFAPKGVTTRAQIVQILYNLAGKPAVAGTTPFTDLTNDWYQNAILWAYQTGVVAGTSATTFDPESPVTREQVATILQGFCTRTLGWS